jgi:hypothetical protein
MEGRKERRKEGRKGGWKEGSEASGTWLIKKQTGGPF